MSTYEKAGNLHGVIGVLVAPLDVLGREVEVCGRVFELRAKLVDLPTKISQTTALEATQGQMDGFFSQLPYKCHLEEVASGGD